jgi:hypothetical protein
MKSISIGENIHKEITGNRESRNKPTQVIFNGSLTEDKTHFNGENIIFPKNGAENYGHSRE